MRSFEKDWFSVLLHFKEAADKSQLLLGGRVFIVNKEMATFFEDNIDFKINCHMHVDFNGYRYLFTLLGWNIYVKEDTFEKVPRN